jgi:hypothetical protein
MLFLNQVITQEEINSFKQFFQDYQSKKYVNYQIGDQIIDHRLIIPTDSPLFDIIKRIVATNFSNPIHYWSAYQQQTVPHNIHIDDYGIEEKHLRYTYILAMDSVPEFKAIIWKEKCWDNDALHTFVEQWGKMKKFKKKTSNISEVEDLEHTFDSNQDSYMADYLTLDGVYTYQVGTACLFDASQLHCTSNWVKYNKFPHRELLQIHVLSDHEPIF